jgi:imidazolonepropionase-like amidohydrolase
MAGYYRGKLRWKAAIQFFGISRPTNVLRRDKTATTVPARMTGMDGRVGSIAKGKAADIILVDGDV